MFTRTALVGVLAGMIGSAAPAYGQSERRGVCGVTPVIVQVRAPTPNVLRVRDRAALQRQNARPWNQNALDRIAREKAAAAPPVQCRQVCKPVRHGFSRGGRVFGRHGFEGLTARIDGVSQVSPPLPPPTPPVSPAPLTDLERAELMISDGDTEGGIAALREHLDAEPGDWASARLLGLALIEVGSVDDGVSVIGLAYRSDPLLAHHPIETELLGSRLRRVRTLAVRHAHRFDTSSGWVTVGALIQAEGRTGHARRMIERARAAGLPASVGDEFGVALRGFARK